MSQLDQGMKMIFKLKLDHDSHLQDLLNFRVNPISVVPYLKQRLTRFSQSDGACYLFSEKYPMKALQMKQTSYEARVKQLINNLQTKTPPLQDLVSLPKLQEIASKLCHTLQPQMSHQIKFKPQTARVLRAILNQDPEYEFPNSVICLVSLGFDLPHEALVNMLIDDGLANRPNRKSLLDPNVKYVGVSSLQNHEQPQLRCTVYVLTQKIIPKVTSSNFTTQGPPQVIHDIPMIFNNEVQVVNSDASQPKTQPQKMDNVPFQRPMTFNPKQEVLHQGFNIDKNQQSIKASNNFYQNSLHIEPQQQGSAIKNQLNDIKHDKIEGEYLNKLNQSSSKLQPKSQVLKNQSIDSSFNSNEVNRTNDYKKTDQGYFPLKNYFQQNHALETKPQNSLQTEKKPNANMNNSSDWSVLNSSQQLNPSNISNRVDTPTQPIITEEVHPIRQH